VPLRKVCKFETKLKIISRVLHNVNRRNLLCVAGKPNMSNMSSRCSDEEGRVRLLMRLIVVCSRASVPEWYFLHTSIVIVTYANNICVSYMHRFFPRVESFCI